MGEAEVIHRNPGEPVTHDVLVADLHALGLEPGTTVVVHSSLSALGWVCGGEITVIRALMEVIRPFGNIVMPTHTGHLSDPAQWENPSVPQSWWAPIRKSMPPFDSEVTPSRGMGRIPELFRTMPDVVRSSHPHFSFAAWGENSVDIVADHSLDFGIGEGTPLARVYELDGMVLLLGVDFDRNTSFHLAENRARYRTREELFRMAPILVNGHRRWKKYRDINIDSDDFREMGRDFCRHNERIVHTGQAGFGRCCLFKQRAAVDYAVEWLARNRK